MLAQLILLNGMQTSPDLPGGEKLCGTYVDRSWLANPLRDLKPDHDLGMDPASLAPEQIFMVKGFNRSVCCLGVLYACYSNNELLEAGLFYVLFTQCYLFGVKNKSPVVGGTSGSNQRAMNSAVIRNTNLLTKHQCNIFWWCLRFMDLPLFNNDSYQAVPHHIISQCLL